MRNLILLLLLTSGVMWGQDYPNGTEFTFHHYERTIGSRPDFTIARIGTPCTLNTGNRLLSIDHFVWVGPAGENQAIFNDIRDDHNRNGATEVHPNRSRRHNSGYFCTD